MFDTEKIRRMTALLEKLPEEFDDVYLIPEKIFLQETAVFLRRLKIPVKGIMHDMQLGKETWGIPIVKTAEASANFNERTALILLTEKPVPFIQTTFDFKVRGGKWTLPALVMTNDEVWATYAHLMIQKFMRTCAEGNDGLPPNFFAELFARGLTTVLDSRYQNFKYQFRDSRECFKPRYDFDDTAIVIQGPIEYTNNYTAETFKLYRSIYPNAPILISTWKNEATNSFRRECKENSVVLLENEPPEIRGPLNVNMQLKSSLEGVRYVRENTSAKFVLKTRTDQRINYFNFLVYFKNLLETFPPKGDKLRERIIFLSSIEAKSIPFFFTDFLSFGHVEDISRLYDVPLHGNRGEITYAFEHLPRIIRLKNELFYHPIDYRLVTKPSRKLYKFNRMISRFCSPEDYIVKNFYRKFIAPIDNSKLLETSWKFIVDYTVLTDEETLLIDWVKYESIRYKVKFNFENESAFARWLDMYRNFKIDWV